MRALNCPVNQLLVASAVISCLAVPSRAAELCGRLPVFDHTTTEATGSIVIGFLKGLIGKGDLEGSFKSTPEDVLHQYPNPDKLLPRITVFVVECNLVVNDTELTPSQKREEILKIYNEVFLQKGGFNLNQVGAKLAALVLANPHTMADVESIQAILPVRPSIQDQISAKEAWRQKWFHESPEGPAPTNVPGRYHVIVASPCGEDAAQKAITSYNTKYPDIYFELWRTVDKCYFAVTVGTGLEQAQAKELLALVKQRGMKGFLWHW